MVTELIRPSVYVSYDVELGTKEYFLAYSNLNLNYVEEQIREGWRGYVIVAKSKPQNFKIADCFGGTTNIYFGQGESQYEIKVCPNNTVRDINKYKALPYGCVPVEVAQVDKYKIKDALVGHLLRRLINNFEVDAIRAVIGDFATSEEVQSKRKKIIRKLSEQWKQKLLPRRHDQQGEILILSSPVVCEVLQNLTPQQPRQSLLDDKSESYHPRADVCLAKQPQQVFFADKNKLRTPRR